MDTTSGGSSSHSASSASSRAVPLISSLSASSSTSNSTWVRRVISTSARIRFMVPPKEKPSTREGESVVGQPPCSECHDTLPSHPSLVTAVWRRLLPVRWSHHLAHPHRYRLNTS